MTNDPNDTRKRDERERDEPLALEAYEALADAGFVIERLVEPLPIPKFREADPEDYAKLLR